MSKNGRTLGKKTCPPTHASEKIWIDTENDLAVRFRVRIACREP
jgi:hypothetical protein